MSLLRISTLTFLIATISAASAAAQPLGTFRWQLQPYCNLLIVNVSQQGGIYTLDGIDDRCAATQSASLVGIAFLNPSGSVGFGMTVVLPNGTPVHIEATINMTSLHGSWRDSAGNSGNLIFTAGAGIGGSPRPVPSGGLAANSVTSVQIAPLAVGATQLAADAVSSSHIANGTITTADLAAPTGSAFVASSGTSVSLGANTEVRAITITAPAAGRVIVGAQGLVENNAASVDSSACVITTGTTLETNQATFMTEQSADSMRYVPFALTRGFDVSAGANTFRVVCHEYSGTVIAWYTSMTAIFTP